MELNEILKIALKGGASDIHLKPGLPAMFRVDGALVPLKNGERLSPEQVQKMAYGIMSPVQKAKFDETREVDLAYGIAGLGRFRVNCFQQRGTVGIVFRVIPFGVKSIEQLHLPKVIESIAMEQRGLILVTGTTGSGKSTTLAAMIDYINKNQNGHIVTIEDPVEFTHRHQRCLVTQREVGSDTKGFHNALKSALRQDPDYVLIGEMRDHETIEAALTLAETGHLTFGTLHTSDAVQTVNRIIDVFPSHQQAQVRTQLSFSLEAVFCQQLLPLQVGRGRALAAEIMLATPAIRALIRDGKGHQIYSAIQTGGKLQMNTMSQSLANLVRQGKVSVDTAEHYIGDTSELRTLIRAA